MDFNLIDDLFHHKQAQIIPVIYHLWLNNGYLKVKLHLISHLCYLILVLLWLLLLLMTIPGLVWLHILLTPKCL